MSLSKSQYVEYCNLEDVYDELIALHDKSVEKGFNLGQALYTQAAFFVDYQVLLCSDAQNLIKDYLFCKTFNCPPHKSLADTPNQLKDKFLIIDSEYGKVKSENQKEKNMKDKK
tara:strand:- start:600 stop:941 length:342 start_codon:yes stop_codon:yes gene_type:complete